METLRTRRPFRRRGSDAYPPGNRPAVSGVGWQHPGMTSAHPTPLAAKLALAFALIGAGLGGAALAVELSASDLADRIVITHNASAGDDTDDKGTRAQCPPGSTLLAGGAAVQHGHATPSVAVYQGLPIQGGWEVQAHETDPEDDPRRPWTLEAIAVCLRPR